MISKTRKSFNPLSAQAYPRSGSGITYIYITYINNPMKNMIYKVRFKINETELK